MFYFFIPVLPQYRFLCNFGKKLNVLEVDDFWLDLEDDLEPSKFGKELKERYDLVFATQVVKSLDKQGLLKENVAKLILENK